MPTARPTCRDIYPPFVCEQEIILPTVTESINFGSILACSIAALAEIWPISTEPTSLSLPPNAPNGVRLQPTMNTPKELNFVPNLKQI